MIESIRVKARAASMDEAKREIEAVLGHASNAVYLEGLGGAATLTDNHFGDVFGTDQWGQVGLRCEGRMVLTFEPIANPGGGLKQYSFVVTGDESEQRPEMRSELHGKDLTDKVFVSYREFPVTRENSWDGLVTADDGESAEVLLDRLRGLPHVDRVEVGMDETQRDRSGWRVTTTYVAIAGSSPMALSVGAETLRDAVVAALEGASETTEVPTTLTVGR